MGVDIMSTAVNSMYETVNDYLDLLNYAKQLHDVEWQQSIIQQLKQLQNLSLNGSVKNVASIQDIQGIGDVKSDNVTIKLWNRLDEINTNMISLFLAISQTQDEEEKGVLLYALHELKQEQILVSEKIKALS